MGSSDSVWANVLNPLKALWATIVAYLPNLFAALVLLFFGYVFARLLAWAARKITRRFRVERLSKKAGLQEAVNETGLDMSVSTVIGQIVFWMIMLTFMISAANALGLPRLSATIQQAVLYLPRLLGAVLIGLIGVFVAHLARKGIQSASRNIGLTYGTPLASLVYGLLIVVTASLAISQLQIKMALLNQLVLVVVLAVGAAIALSLGLGARDLAGNVIAGIYARDLFQPGSRIEVGAISGQLIAVGTAKTLIQSGDKIVSVSNKLLIEETVHNTPAN